jgi:hypothetical protein
MCAFESIYGLGPQIPPPYDLEPVAQMVVRWQWANPLAAILQFGGWTIDDAVADPRVAAAVRQLWKVWKESKRHQAEREAKLLLMEQIRWRREGCPVPCPYCARIKPCACRIPPELL